MFARAAIVGRVARERAEARRSFIDQKAEIKRKIPQLPYRQRCFIPFLKGPCMTVGCGFFLILCGAVMCNFAFHAKELAVVKVPATRTNSTTVSSGTPDVTTNKTTYIALKSLTFIGPSLMGLGIFVIIIACVLLFDKRDKVIREFMEGLIRHQQDISMEMSFRSMHSGDPSKQTKNGYDCKGTDNSTHKGSMPSNVSSMQSFHNIIQNISEVGRNVSELEPLDENSRSGSGDSLLPPDGTESSEVDMGRVTEIIDTNMQNVCDVPEIAVPIAEDQNQPIPDMNHNQIPLGNVDTNNTDVTSSVHVDIDKECSDFSDMYQSGMGTKSSTDRELPSLWFGPFPDDAMSTDSVTPNMPCDGNTIELMDLSSPTSDPTPEISVIEMQNSALQIVNEQIEHPGYDPQHFHHTSDATVHETLTHLDKLSASSGTLCSSASNLHCELTDQNTESINSNDIDPAQQSNDRDNADHLPTDLEGHTDVDGDEKTNLHDDVDDYLLLFPSSLFGISDKNGDSIV